MAFEQSVLTTAFPEDCADAATPRFHLGAIGAHWLTFQSAALTNHCTALAKTHSGSQSQNCAAVVKKWATVAAQKLRIWKRASGRYQPENLFTIVMERLSPQDEQQPEPNQRLRIAPPGRNKPVLGMFSPQPDNSSHDNGGFCPHRHTAADQPAIYPRPNQCLRRLLCGKRFSQHGPQRPVLPIRACANLPLSGQLRQQQS